MYGFAISEPNVTKKFIAGGNKIYNPKIKPSKGLEKRPAAIKNDPIPRNPLIEPFLKFFFFLDFV